MKACKFKTTTAQLFFFLFLISLAQSGCFPSGNSKAGRAHSKAQDAIESAEKLLQQHPDSSIWYGNRALGFIRALNRPDSLMYRVWSVKADAFDYLGKQDSALAVLDEWFNHAVQKGDSLQIGSAGLEIASYQVNSGRHQLAENLLQNALDHLRNPAYRIKKAEVLEVLANVYVRTGDYLKAKEKFLEAEKIYTSEKKEHHLASFRNNFANMLKDIGDYEKALHYYRLAEGTFRNLEDLDNLSSTFVNIGIVYRKSAPDSAMYYYRQADSLYRKVNNEPCIICKYNAANVYLDRKDFAAARQLFSEVEQLCQAKGIIGGLARVYLAYGDIESRQGNYRAADQYLEEGASLAREAGELPISLKLMQARFDLLRETSPDKQWISLADDIRTTSDSLHSLEIKRSVHELETQYRLGEKELENQRVRSAFEREETLNRYLFFGIGSISLIAILLGISLWYTQKLRREKSYAYDALMEKYRQERLQKMEAAEMQTEKLPLETDLFERVNLVFKTEKLFKDQTLKLEDVCDKMQTNPRSLGAALKKEGFKNFAHFVNQHRVQEARDLMDTYENDIYTIEAIADMAGFGTRQSFYNTFEKFTGLKPAYYRASVKDKKNQPVEPPAYSINEND